jgi:hypothetical protein
MAELALTYANRTKVKSTLPGQLQLDAGAVDLPTQHGIVGRRVYQMVAEEFGAAFDETKTSRDQICDGSFDQLRLRSLRLPDLVGWRRCRVSRTAGIGKDKT